MNNIWQKLFLLLTISSIAFSDTSLADEFNTDGLYIGDYSGNDRFINGNNSGNYGIVNDSIISSKYFDNGNSGATGEIQSSADITVTRNFLNGDGNGGSIGIINGGTINIGRDFRGADETNSESYINGGTITVGRDFKSGDGTASISNITGGTITVEDEFRNGSAGTGTIATISGGTITVNDEDLWNGYGLGTTGIINGGSINILNGDFENARIGGGTGIVTGGTIIVGDDFDNNGANASINTASNLTLTLGGDLDNQSGATIINNSPYILDVTANHFINDGSFTNNGTGILNANIINNSSNMSNGGTLTITEQFDNFSTFTNTGATTIEGDYYNHNSLLNSGTMTLSGDIKETGDLFTNTGTINFGSGTITGNVLDSGNWNMTGITEVIGNWTQTGSLDLLATGVIDTSSMHVQGTFEATTGSSLNLNVMNINPITTTNYDIIESGLLSGTGLTSFIADINLLNTNGTYVYDFAQNTNDLILTAIVVPEDGISLSSLTFEQNYLSDIRYDGLALNEDVNGDLIVNGLDIIYNDLNTSKTIGSGFSTTAEADFTIITGEDLQNSGTLNTEGNFINNGTLLNEGIINLDGNFVGGVGNTFSNTLGTVNTNTDLVGITSISGLTSASGIWNIVGDTNVIGLGNKLISGTLTNNATLSMAGNLENIGTFINNDTINWQGGELKGVIDFQNIWDFQEDSRLDGADVKTNNGTMSISDNKVFDIQGNFINEGIFNFGDNASIHFLDNFTNNATIVDSGSNITLDGNFEINANTSIHADSTITENSDIIIDNTAILTNAGEININGDSIVNSGNINNTGTISISGSEISDVQNFNGIWHINAGEVSQTGTSNTIELIALEDSVIHLGNGVGSGVGIDDTFVNASESGSVAVQVGSNVDLDINSDAIITVVSSDLTPAIAPVALQVEGDGSSVHLNDGKIVTDGVETVGIQINGDENIIVLHSDENSDHLVSVSGNNSTAIEVNGNNTILNIHGRIESSGINTTDIDLAGGETMVNFMETGSKVNNVIKNTSTNNQYLTFGYGMDANHNVDLAIEDTLFDMTIDSNVLNSGGGDLDIYIAGGNLTINSNEAEFTNVFIGANNFATTTILASSANEQTIDAISGATAEVTLGDNTGITVSGDLEIGTGSVLNAAGTLDVSGVINNLGEINTSGNEVFITNVSDITGGGIFNNNGKLSIESALNVIGNYNQTGILQLFAEASYIVGTGSDSALDINGTATFENTSEFIFDLSHLNTAAANYDSNYNMITSTNDIVDNGIIFSNTTFLGADLNNYNYVFEEGATAKSLILNITESTPLDEVWLSPITLANDYNSGIDYAITPDFDDGDGLSNTIHNTRSIFKVINTGESTTAQGNFTIVNGDILTIDGTLGLSGDNTTLLNQGIISNNGALNITGDNTTLEIDGGTLDNTNGTITLTGNNTHIDGLTFYSGDWVFDDGSSTIDQVDTGITILASASITNTVDSELTIEGNFHNDGTFTNAGIINYDGDVNNSNSGIGELSGMASFEGTQWNINAKTLLEAGNHTIDVGTTFNLTDDLYLNGSLTNNGLLTNEDVPTTNYISSSQLDNVVEIQNNGTLNLIGDVDLDDQPFSDTTPDTYGFHLFNSGTINYGGGTFNNLSSLSGVFNLEGDTYLTGSTSYDLLGATTLDPSVTFTTDASLISLGSLTLESGSNLDITGDLVNEGVFINNGATTIDISEDFISSADFENDTGGTMNVGGEFTQDANTFTNTGTLNVGGTSFDSDGGTVNNTGGTINLTKNSVVIDEVFDMTGIWNLSGDTEFTNSAPTNIIGTIYLDSFRDIRVRDGDLNINLGGSLILGTGSHIIIDGDFNNHGVINKTGDGANLLTVLENFTSSTNMATAPGSLFSIGGNFTLTDNTFRNNGDVVIGGNATIDAGATAIVAAEHFDLGGDLTVNGTLDNSFGGGVHMTGVGGTITGLSDFEGEWHFEENTTIDNNATFTGQTDIVSGGAILNINGDGAFDNSAFTFIYTADDTTNDVIKITADNLIAMNSPTFLLDFLPSSDPEAGDQIQLFDIAGTANNDYIVTQSNSNSIIVMSYDYNTYLATFDYLKEDIAGSYGTNVLATFNTNHKISTTVKNRLRKLGLSSGDALDKAYGIWGDMSGGSAKQNSRKGSDGYDSSYNGITFGTDFEINPQAELGVAVTYASTDVDGRNNSTGDNTEIDTYSLTGYGSYDFEDSVTFEGQASIAYSDYDSIRDLTDLSAGIANGEYYGYTYGLEARLTKDYDIKNEMTVAPLIGLSYYHTDLDNYQETGSSGDLNVDSQKYDSLTLSLGTELDFAKYKTKNDWDISTGIHGYVDHEFIIDEYTANARYVGDSTTFSTKGLKPAPNSVSIGGEIGFSNDQDVEITLSYDADIKEDYLGHRGTIRMRKDF